MLVLTLCTCRVFVDAWPNALCGLPHSRLQMKLPVHGGCTAHWDQDLLLPSTSARTDLNCRVLGSATEGLLFNVRTTASPSAVQSVSQHVFLFLVPTFHFFVVNVLPRFACVLCFL